tara:strand:+ start:1357 stop:2115 length:759 start_codon:yes stop_codon:yes gene_type:complete
LIKVLVFGATGRMGLEVIKAISDSKTFKLVTAIGSPHSKYIAHDTGILSCGRANNVLVSTSLNGILEDVDVAIDFSSPDSSIDCLRYCAEKAIRFISGTTGFQDHHHKEIQILSKKTAVCIASNFSQGIALMSMLVEMASKTIGHDTQILINETHHKDKVDAPSGTAIDLAASIHKRYKNNNADKEVRFSSTRSGSDIGSHKVSFISKNESIFLNHEVTDRAVFSSGALMAAKWIIEKDHGIFSMRDVLSLS